MKKLLLCILFSMNCLRADIETFALLADYQSIQQQKKLEEQKAIEEIESLIQMRGSVLRNKFNLPVDKNKVDVKYFFGQNIENSNITQMKRVDDVEDLKFGMPLTGKDAYFVVYKKHCLPCANAMGILEFLAYNIKGTGRDIFKITSSDLSDKVTADLNLKSTPTIYRIKEGQWDFSVENDNSCIEEISLEDLIENMDNRSIFSKYSSIFYKYGDLTLNYVKNNKLSCLTGLTCAGLLLYAGYKYYKNYSKPIQNKKI